MVICVDSHPFTPLSGRVDGIEGDGDVTLDVAPEDVRRQAEALPGFLVRGPEVIMPAAIRVRPVRLQGVGPPVHKEAEVVRHHTGWRFQTKLPHSLLPEVRWAPHVHNVVVKPKIFSVKRLTGAC